MGSSENAGKNPLLHSPFVYLSETSRNGIIKSLTSPEQVRGTMQKRTTLNKVVPPTTSKPVLQDLFLFLFQTLFFLLLWELQKSSQG